MPQLSTLKLVADIVVARVLSDAVETEDLAAVLEDAYPFGNDPCGRQVWLDALLRHAFAAGHKIDSGFRAQGEEFWADPPAAQLKKTA